MIIENTFTSMKKIVDHLMPAFKPLSSFILRNKWESEENIKLIKEPILFIKCKK